jgi:uncharacterized phosphosugar-binding protein
MFAYFDVIRQLLNEAERRNAGALEQAADVIATSIQQDGILHAFGTGHSHMIAEEIFDRAGGLVPVNAMLDPSLMLHVSASSSTGVERLSGYAELVLERYKVSPKDVMLIISNSGRNAVPIEMAMTAKARGLPVIALTALAYSQGQPSRHTSGKRLFEVADLVLDNCGPYGDAALEVEGLPERICATSTVMGAAIVQALMHNVLQKLAARGFKPPIFRSANASGGDDYSTTYIEKYRDRVRHL